MRGKFIAAAVLTALLATALGAALAAPGTESDPFITLSYLTDTYRAEAELAMLEQAQAATAQTEEAAFDRLDALAGGYLAQAGEGADYADDFIRITLSQGDRLDLSTGAALLFENGTCQLALASGALLDVTEGIPAGGDGSLSAGHYYVAAEDTACSVTAVSDAAYLSVSGCYELESTGLTHTPFIDLFPSDWYYADVYFVYTNNLFQGQTSPITFEPNTNMNRAMLAAVLSRLAGMRGDVFSAGYSDVPDDAWYADAVNWAAWAGIVNGMGDGTYLPERDVTREEMAVMLYRYARDFAGMEVPATGDLTAFSDHFSASSWARDALSWAVGHGILTGYPDDTLAPGGTATRAEVAAMIQRFCALLPVN